MGAKELAAAFGTGVEIAGVAVLDVGHEAGDAVFHVLLEDEVELVGDETKAYDVDGFGVVLDFFEEFGFFGVVESAVGGELERWLVVAVVPDSLGHALVVVGVGEGRLTVGGVVGNVIEMVVEQCLRSSGHITIKRTVVES